MGLFVNRDPGSARLRPLIEIKAFRVACGEFISISDVEKQELEVAGWAPVPDGIRFREGMFAVRARGPSMQPEIDDGDWCIFVPDPGGTRNNRLVLVEDRSRSGVERYTLKRYHSEKEQRSDGTWRHSEITLWPLNALDHAPIPLDAHGNYDIGGWFVGRVRQISRIEEYRYEYVFDEI